MTKPRVKIPSSEELKRLAEEQAKRPSRVLTAVERDRPDNYYRKKISRSKMAKVLKGS